MYLNLNKIFILRITSTHSRYLKLEHLKSNYRYDISFLIHDFYRTSCLFCTRFFVLFFYFLFAQCFIRLFDNIYYYQNLGNVEILTECEFDIHIALGYLQHTYLCSPWILCSHALFYLFYIALCLTIQDNCLGKCLYLSFLIIKCIFFFQYVFTFVMLMLTVICPMRFYYNISQE